MERGGERGQAGVKREARNCCRKAEPAAGAGTGAGAGAGAGHQVLKLTPTTAKRDEMRPDACGMSREAAEAGGGSEGGRR